MFLCYYFFFPDFNKRFFNTLILYPWPQGLVVKLYSIKMFSVCFHNIVEGFLFISGVQHGPVRHCDYIQ